MEGRYEFVSPEWDDISDQAKDMVRMRVVLGDSQLEGRTVKPVERKQCVDGSCSEVKFACEVHTILINTLLMMTELSLCQIRKLLVTDPGLRLTADGALSHPFLLQRTPVDFVVFSARTKFRVSVQHMYCIVICIAVCDMYNTWQQWIESHSLRLIQSVTLQ